MKHLFLVGAFCLFGLGSAEAQTVIVKGRAVSVDIEETSTTRKTKITCDGWYQNEECYRSTSTGAVGTGQGRANLTLQAFGAKGFYYSGPVLDFFIDDSSDRGGVGHSEFTFIKKTE